MGAHPLFTDTLAVASGDMLRRIEQRASDMQRAGQLIIAAQMKLNTAKRLTDFPGTLALVERYEKKVEKCRDVLARSPEYVCETLGPNGYGPAIDDVLKSARFHGKPWRRRTEDARINIGEAQ
jgi:hypothetical protein